VKIYDRFRLCHHPSEDIYIFVFQSRRFCNVDKNRQFRTFIQHSKFKRKRSRTKNKPITKSTGPSFRADANVFLAAKVEVVVVAQRRPWARPPPHRCLRQRRLRTVHARPASRARHKNPQLLSAQGAEWSSWTSSAPARPATPASTSPSRTSGCTYPSTAKVYAIGRGTATSTVLATPARSSGRTWLASLVPPLGALRRLARGCWGACSSLAGAGGGGGSLSSSWSSSLKTGRGRRRGSTRAGRGRDHNRGGVGCWDRLLETRPFCNQLERKKWCDVDNALDQSERSVSFSTVQPWCVGSAARGANGGALRLQ